MATTYEPIATYTSTGTVNTYTFTSIPQTYTDLIMVSSTKTASGTSQNLVRVNSDSGSNYSYTVLYAGGSARSANNTVWACEDINATEFNVSTIQFNNYSNTTTYKSVVARFDTPSQYTVAFTGLWRSTSAITSITCWTNSTSNFAAGSTLTLYGIKAA